MLQSIRFSILPKKSKHMDEILMNKHQEQIFSIETFLNQAGLDADDRILFFTTDFTGFLVSDEKDNNFHVTENSRQVLLFVNRETTSMPYTENVYKIIEYYHIYKNMVHGC